MTGDTKYASPVAVQCVVKCLDSVCGEMPGLSGLSGRMMAECRHVLSGVTPKNILLNCYVTSEIFRIFQKSSTSKRENENDLFATSARALIASRPAWALPCLAVAGSILSHDPA